MAKQARSSIPSVFDDESTTARGKAVRKGPQPRPDDARVPKDADAAPHVFDIDDSDKAPG